MSIPVWDQRVKSGIVKISTVQKIQVELGILFID